MAAQGAERLEKSVEIGNLCAFYGGLLTQRQQEALRLHYEEDYTLGEIADQLGVSRQNVHELITRSAQKLRRYEAALGLVKRAENTARVLRQARELMELAGGGIASHEKQSLQAQAAQMIETIIRQQEGEENEHGI